MILCACVRLLVLYSDTSKIHNKELLTMKTTLSCMKTMLIPNSPEVV